jgi:hypothetical protein
VAKDKDESTPTELGPEEPQKRGPGRPRKAVPALHEPNEEGVRQALANPNVPPEIPPIDETIPGGKFIVGMTINSPGTLVNSAGQPIDDDGNPLDGSDPIRYSELR